MSALFAYIPPINVRIYRRNIKIHVPDMLTFFIVRHDIVYLDCPAISRWMQPLLEATACKFPRELCIFCPWNGLGLGQSMRRPVTWERGREVPAVLIASYPKERARVRRLSDKISCVPQDILKLPHRFKDPINRKRMHLKQSNSTNIKARSNCCIRWIRST